MSRPAGTLITTHNATYIPPRFMPGYKGHVPTMKFDYAETYGNHTAKYFQDYRSKTLESSKSNYCQGGYFPTAYSHNPDLAITNRTRNRDHYLYAPRYTLTNVDHDRKEELTRFNKLAQSHRDHYSDKSGTARRVDYFMLPTPSDAKFNKPITGLTSTFYSPEDSSMAESDKKVRRRAVLKEFSPTSSQRDREMRDVYFEKR